MKQWWKEFKRSVQSFRLWAPVLFSDRWFDSAYLLAIIERKCSYDARMYLERGHCTDNLAVACALQEVAELCHKLQDVDKFYYEPFYVIHTEKWKEAHYESAYPRAKESQELEHTELLAATEKGTEVMEADLIRLGALFQKVYTWSD